MSDLKPRMASVVIYQGDDLERLAELRRAAEIASRNEASASARLGDEGDAQAAKDAYDAFVDEAADRAIVVEVVAVKRALFRELMAKHPAREDNEGDAAFAVNIDDFPPAFLAESVAKVVVGERELTPAQTRDLLDDLPEGDYERVFATAYWLNRAPGSDPREGRYSAAPLTSPAN